MSRNLLCSALSWAVLVAFSSAFTGPNSHKTSVPATSGTKAKPMALMTSCDPGDPAFVDTDGDGVGNDCDLDDDNDGILDTNECAPSDFFWSGKPTIVGNTATGTINGIGYTYQSSQPIGATGGVFGIGNFPASYGVPSVNPTIQNTQITNNTLTFASPMTDPVLVFASIGSASISVGINFGAPVEILWSQSVVQNTSTKITGTEGYAIVRMTGTFSSVTFNYTVAENWANFVFGATVPRVCDFDGDGIADQLDADSDNDGCPDAIEAGGTDGDGDGKLGVSPVQVDVNGRVTGQGGYTANFQNAKRATRLLVDTAPGNQSVESGGTTSFSVAANAASTTAYTASVPNYTDPSATNVSGTIQYQWQEDTGSGFANISNGGIYTGATTATLTLTGVGLVKNGAKYRVVVKHPDNACILEQREATLTVTGCLTDIGGTVYDDPTIQDGVNGSPANGTTLGLYVTLITTGPGAPSQAVVPVSASGTFLFSNVPAGSHQLVLGTTAGGSTEGQMPTGYFAIREGAAVASGSGEGDGTADGIIGFTADCAGIQYTTARIAGDVSYLDNNFAISIENPLPVTLISFSVTAEEQNVRLNWNTSAETNSDRFEIQRSRDGKNWAALASVDAKGESRVNEAYTYLDRQARSGNNFYRLKMIDNDGTFAFSSLKGIRIEGQELVVAYPNPSDGAVQLTVADWKRVVNVTAVDMNGRKVFETGRPKSETVPLPALGKGVSVLKILYEDGTVEAVKVVRR
ncbi:hypothetical protein J2Y45_004015 [Dyadobacter sp. BE34]|uniref:Secretion system C-terminal sorting domain-containing protein n=1 Tax=Dyadobacter fermentans TaxID=94254 RepID=A0ABU1R094_9BACT|nr:MULTISPECIES: T9SS type A sorting domain-containing protein [Dyadobacter]MDR6806823.1 hypothetical protein [Dyadobacter fermentans]MDR7044565.1 hypothetical protein [Dyadobacter sp. BE242]MDR7198875.1 hypothetical protein [Dyadobacter sp. BE34]MDR7216837.1 hypothetical protein [Dyadobacter sp. BE31]MDR7263637.1 hypothetical protein [Dyadobacter sp. BE32]